MSEMVEPTTQSDLELPRETERGFESRSPRNHETASPLFL